MSLTIPSETSPEYSIQLSYPPANVKKLSMIGGNNGFYFMTPGVSFNLAFVDSSNNRSISGFSSKAILHKQYHITGTIGELTIIHQKNNSNEQFYLVIPLKYNVNAKSNLSSYLNTTEAEFKLDIGSDIAGSNIVYYNNGSADVFVVASPVEVSMDNVNDTYAVFGKTMTNPKLIKSTLTNDDIVCDYEGDITEDSSKSSETKQVEINMVWANIVPIFIIGIVFFLCSKSIIPREQLIIAALVTFITAIVATALIKKTKPGSINYAGIIAGTLWILFVIFAGFFITYK